MTPEKLKKILTVGTPEFEERNAMLYERMENIGRMLYEDIECLHREQRYYYNSKTTYAPEMEVELSQELRAAVNLYRKIMPY